MLSKIRKLYGVEGENRMMITVIGELAEIRRKLVRRKYFAICPEGLRKGMRNFSQIATLLYIINIPDMKHKFKPPP
jgi:hypothetical protein